MKADHYLSRPVFPGYWIYPESFGWYSGLADHRVHRLSGQLPYYNLHLIFEGRGEIYCKKKRHELSAGQGFLFAPGMEQRYGALPEDPWNIR